MADRKIMRWAAFLAAAAISLPVRVLAQGWSQYSYPDQGFSIQLPSQPEVTSATVSSPKEIAGPAKIYSLKNGGAVYTVRVIDMSGSTTSSQDAIQTAEREMSAQGNVVQALSERINQQFGRELSIAKPDGGKIIAAIFYVNRHLVELSGTANGADAQAASADLVRFQQSLAFTGQGGGRFGGGGRGGPGGRGGRGFNQPAIDACSGRAAGDKVQFQTPAGPAAATCVLVARPDRPPGQ